RARGASVRVHHRRAGARVRDLDGAAGAEPRGPRGHAQPSLERHRRAGGHVDRGRLLAERRALPRHGVARGFPKPRLHLPHRGRRRRHRRVRLHRAAAARVHRLVQPLRAVHARRRAALRRRAEPRIALLQRPGSADHPRLRRRRAIDRHRATAARGHRDSRLDVSDRARLSPLARGRILSTAPAPSVTLVTGAAGGLGRVLTADLLSAGHGVVAIDIAAALPRLQQLEAAHPRRLIGRAAPRTDGEWLALLDDAQRTLSPITGAVLLAGGWRGGGAIGSEPDGELQTLIDRNLLAAHAALRALIPRLREHGGGAIVVIGSRVVERPWESAGAAAYAASKAALVTL